MQNEIESMETAVNAAVPGVHTILRHPRDPDGQWWLDAKFGTVIVVTVSWSPRDPFVVSVDDGAAEPCASVDEATGRVIRLLRERIKTELQVTMAEIAAFREDVRAMQAARELEKEAAHAILIEKLAIAVAWGTFESPPVDGPFEGMANFFEFYEKNRELFIGQALPLNAMIDDRRPFLGTAETVDRVRIVVEDRRPYVTTHGDITITLPKTDK